MIVRLALFPAERFSFLAKKAAGASCQNKSFMLCTTSVSVSMTTHNSKSGSNHFTNCNLDHTFLQRACGALSIRGVLFKCSHMRTSHINDKSFVPGYLALWPPSSAKFATKFVAKFRKVGR